jgi:hypothetical protein
MKMKISNEVEEKFLQARENIRLSLGRIFADDWKPTSTAHIAPQDFESWLESEGLPRFYGDLFSMSRVDLIRIYDSTFDRIELLEALLSGHKFMFEQLRQLRLEYVRRHGIRLWSALQSEDYHHLEWKAEVFRKIEELVPQIRATKEEIKVLERLHKLVSCVLLNVHADFESLRFARFYPEWNAWPTHLPILGEIFGIEPEVKRLRSYRDVKWDKFPRIDWGEDNQ